MLKNFRFIFILSILISSHAYAQDTAGVTITENIKTNFSPVSGFSSASAYNPGAMVYSLKTSLSDIALSYEKQTGKAGLAETGTAFDSFTFDAESYMNNGKHYIWGTASYENKRTDNKKWNESSDYYNIYPYVTGNSLGGDNLKGERYSFNGGYAQKLDKIAWGIQIDYFALLEYRTKDPRPDNNTSNLTVKGGGNYKLTDKYAVGGGILLRKYKQKNDLSFNNALGALPGGVFHMTGLGSDAYLFATDYKSTIYNGKGYGFNVQLLPVTGKGLSATFSFENFSFDKQFRGDQKLAISSIDENKYVFDVSYLKEIGKQTLGIKIDVSNTNREGEENKFTKNENGSFVKIASEKQYKNEITAANLSLIYQQDNINTSWYVMPYVWYSETEESHKTTERKMTVRKMDFGVKPGLSKNIKKHLLHFDGNIGYSSNMDSKLILTGLSDEESITQTLQSNYDYLSSNAFIAGLSARFDYLISPKNMTVYLKGTWHYAKYDHVHSNFLGVQLGVSF